MIYQLFYGCTPVPPPAPCSNPQHNTVSKHTRLSPTRYLYYDIAKNQPLLPCPEADSSVHRQKTVKSVFFHQIIRRFQHIQTKQTRFLNCFEKVRKTEKAEENTMKIHFQFQTAFSPGLLPAGNCDIIASSGAERWFRGQNRPWV